MGEQPGDGTADHATADDHHVVDGRVGTAADGHRSIVAAATRCQARQPLGRLVGTDPRLDDDIRAPVCRAELVV